MKRKLKPVYVIGNILIEQISCGLYDIPVADILKYDLILTDELACVEACSNIAVTDIKSFASEYPTFVSYNEAAQLLRIKIGTQRRMESCFHIGMAPNVIACFKKTTQQLIEMPKEAFA